MAYLFWIKRKFKTKIFLQIVTNDIVIVELRVGEFTDEKIIQSDHTTCFDSSLGYQSSGMFRIILFSERKGYTAVKKCLNVCLFVCPSQSETSFSIFRRFDVLLKLCYTLSMSRNSNLRSNFFSEFSLVRNWTNQKPAFLFFVFSMFG
jgi:hypothetical protein